MTSCRGTGALPIGRRHCNPGAVGVCAIKPLTMASRVRDMRGKAVDPLERVECEDLALLEAQLEKML